VAGRKLASGIWSGFEHRQRDMGGRRRSICIGRSCGAGDPAALLGYGRGVAPCGDSIARLAVMAARLVSLMVPFGRVAGCAEGPPQGDDAGRERRAWRMVTPALAAGTCGREPWCGDRRPSSPLCEGRSSTDPATGGLVRGTVLRNVLALRSLCSSLPDENYRTRHWRAWSVLLAHATGGIQPRALSPAVRSLHSGLSKWGSSIPENR
jgi:hypothetical protein